MHITIKRLAEKTSFELPYYVIQGAKKGPVLLVTAGIHGNEIASIFAAQKLIRLFEKKALHIDQGTLIIVPVVNKKAFEKRIRGFPDLNRTFPRRRNDKALHPLSAALFRLIERSDPSWTLDLHEANGLSSVNKRYIGQTLITNTKNLAIPALKRTLKRINSNITTHKKWFNIRLYERPGSSRTAAARLLNTRAITVETCWSLPLSERIKYHIDIMSNFIKEAGLIKKERKKKAVIFQENDANNNIGEERLRSSFFFF